MLSSINTKHLFKIFTIKVKTVSNLRPLTTASKVYRGRWYSFVIAQKIVHTRSFRPREWRYLWNTQNQLTACFTPKGGCWHYTYDAFGRRLSKTKTVDSDLAHIDPLFPQIKPKITTWRYLWS